MALRGHYDFNQGAGSMGHGAWSRFLWLYLFLHSIYNSLIIIHYSASNQNQNCSVGAKYLYIPKQEFLEAP